MRESTFLITIGVIALAVLGGCGNPPPTRPAWMLVSECALLPVPAETADTVTVALPDAVDPRSAPWAQNASEQIVFNHLYETLIAVDCDEEIQAGLADSWKSAKGGRRWTFELREDARFWDGAPVTAADVVKSWRDALTLDTVVDSARATGDRVLNVYFKHRYRRVPRALSASVFAVTKPSEDARSLLGSGPYRLLTGVRVSSRVSARTIAARPAFNAKGPALRFMETSRRDARDLLEGGIDVMVTSDPTVIEYAASRTRYATAALPWDMTYVLVSVTRVRELLDGGRLGDIPSHLAHGLARDAVRGDARGHERPPWWQGLNRCGKPRGDFSGFALESPGASAAPGSRRILYNSNDRTARDLAERIVALAASDPVVSREAAALASAVPGLKGVQRIIAEGMTPRKMALSMARGEDFAYVVSIPRRPPDPCYEAGELIERAPWLEVVRDHLAQALIPLVDTRRHVIARTDRCGLITDWYGNLLVVSAKLQGN